MIKIIKRLHRMNVVFKVQRACWESNSFPQTALFTRKIYPDRHGLLLGIKSKVTSTVKYLLIEFLIEDKICQMKYLIHGC